MEHHEKIRALLNSYLGTLSHAKTYNLIAKAIKKLVSKFDYFLGLQKIIQKHILKPSIGNGIIH